MAISMDEMPLFVIIKRVPTNNNERSTFKYQEI